MRSFRKYFSYHFRSTLLRCTIICILALVFTLTTVGFHKSTWDGSSYLNYSDRHISVWGDIGSLGFIAAVVASILPFLELSPFKNRRNMDTLLAFPISRTKMAAAHYINGLLHLFMIMVPCFLYALANMFRFLYIYDPLKLLLFFICLMATVVMIYSFFTFIFSLANTTADGVVWVIAYSFIGMLSSVWVYDFIYEETNPLLFSPFSLLLMVIFAFEPFVTPSVHFNIENFPNEITYIERDGKLLLEDGFTFCMIFWSIIAVIAIVGYFIAFNRQKPEKIGGVSNSWLGYRILIPVFILSLDFLFSSFVVTPIFWIAAAIGYIIYRRGFRFKLPDFISLGLIVVVSIVDKAFPL